MIISSFHQLYQMSNEQTSKSCVKIKNFQCSSFHSTRTPFQAERNPIKIVIDKIGADGLHQQQIVNQSEQFQREATQHAITAQLATSRTISMVRPKNHGSLPNLGSVHKVRKAEMGRSHVFNKFHYDNRLSMPAENNSNFHLFRRLKQKGEKNIQVVFCQSKFPDFVNKTNEKIEQIFKKEQLQTHIQNKQFIANHTQREKVTIRKSQKTSLAVCLKQFSTLEKLSIFMENDQNLRQKSLSYGIQRDPSRTLMLDVLNHRFVFMKQLGKRVKDRVYRCLLKRDDIYPFTKLNISEYMAFYEMFVGRDSDIIETATFVYLFLFGGTPSFPSAKAIIEQTNGPIHKQRLALQTLSAMLQDKNNELINVIANNGSFMKLIIDLIVEK